MTSKHTFEVNRYGYVIARGEDKGSLKTQSVEALLLYEILMALRSLKPEQVSGEEFCWLVELFEPDGNSMGYYHTGFTDIGGQSRTTMRPHNAKRYPTREEAEQAASKLHHLSGVWRAIEHGFIA